MTKKLIAILVLALGFFAAETPTYSQPASSLRPQNVARLPSCTPSNKGSLRAVNDATDQDTLGTGGGSAATSVICNGSSWTPIASTVSNIDGDPSIILDTDDSGSDITATPADDLILTAGNDIAASTTAGAVGITAGGTTQDITLTSVDDIILVPTDALTGTIGGAIALTTTAGAVGLTAGGTTQDITLTSVDDIIEAATDDHVHTGDNFGVTTTTVTLNPGASTVELQMSAGVSTFLGSLILPIAAAPPVACAAGSKGTVYYDSDLNELCVCNATDYKQIDDMSTTCS